MIPYPKGPKAIMLLNSEKTKRRVIQYTPAYPEIKSWKDLMVLQILHSIFMNQQQMIRNNYIYLKK